MIAGFGGWCVRLEIGDWRWGDVGDGEMGDWR